MTSNSALERTAGSRALAAAAHRNVRRTEGVTGREFGALGRARTVC
jgi:hypothetical protein